MKAVLLLLITFVSIKSTIAQSITYNTNLLLNVDERSYLFVEAGTGTYDGTSCDIAVGIITAAGGYGCIITGGIAKGGIESCRPGEQQPLHFRISMHDPREIGVFVAQQEGCADGLEVFKVYMEPGNEDTTPDNDLRWTFNTWIKDSAGEGLVFQFPDGQIQVVDSNFDSSSIILTPDLHRTAFKDITDYDDWHITDYYQYIMILSAISHILLISILGWMCWRKNNDNKNKIGFHVIKGNSTFDDDEDEN